MEISVSVDPDSLIWFTSLMATAAIPSSTSLGLALPSRSEGFSYIREPPFLPHVLENKGVKAVTSHLDKMRLKRLHSRGEMAECPPAEKRSCQLQQLGPLQEMDLSFKVGARISTGSTKAKSTPGTKSRGRLLGGVGGSSSVRIGPVEEQLSPSVDEILPRSSHTEPSDGTTPSFLMASDGPPGKVIFPVLNSDLSTGRLGHTLGEISGPVQVSSDVSVNILPTVVPSSQSSVDRPPGGDILVQTVAPCCGAVRPAEKCEMSQAQGNSDEGPVSGDPQIGIGGWPNAAMGSK